MRLRARLAVTAVAVVVPLVVGVLWLDARTRHEAAEQGLRDATLAYMDAPERARCEADPAAWGGRPLAPPYLRGSEGESGGPPELRAPSEFIGAGLDPPVLWAYDEQLRAAHPAAPRLSERSARDLWPGATISTLVRMPWATGPCAFVLAEGSSNPGWIGALLPRSPAWLAPAGAALLVLLASVGPVVRRIRRLTPGESDRKLTAMRGYVTQYENIESEEPRWQADGLPPSDPAKRVVEVFYDLDAPPGG